MKKAFYILLLLLAASMVLNIWQCSNKPKPTVTIEHDTVWKDTTIYQPQAAETISTGKLVYIKVPVESTRIRRDTIHDSIEIPIPIYQKRYSDSLYTAWVSGYEPNLDSIRLYIPEITTTITKTIVKKPRLSFGIQAGAGYGIINRNPDVYIGVGGTYRILP